MASRAYILIHLLDWELAQEKLVLHHDLILHNGRDSEVVRAYREFCLLTGYDQGDPYEYKAYFELPFEASVINDPNSKASFILNLLALVLGEPIQHALYFKIGDREDSRRVYAGRVTEYPIEDYWLNPNPNYSFGENEAEKLKMVFDNLKENRPNAIIHNALEYYYQSWNSAIAEQLCINTSIVIESLFSPSSNNELSFRISLNFALFFHESASGEKRRVFNILKKFYSARSKLVHGERIKDSDKEAISETFRLVSTALFKVLYDKETLLTFSAKRKREDYFSSLLFGD